MKSRDVFDVAVRIIGLVFVFQGLSTLENVLANICTTFPHLYFRLLWPSFVVAGWKLGLAYWMIQGAPWLVRLAYKKDSA